MLHADGTKQSNVAKEQEEVSETSINPHAARESKQQERKKSIQEKPGEDQEVSEPSMNSGAARETARPEKVGRPNAKASHGNAHSSSAGAERKAHKVNREEMKSWAREKSSSETPLRVQHDAAATSSRKLLGNAQSPITAPAGHPFPDIWIEWCNPPTTPKWYQWCNNTYNTQKEGPNAGQPAPDERGWTPSIEVVQPGRALPATGATYMLCCTEETGNLPGVRTCTGQDNLVPEGTTSDPTCPGAQPLPGAY